MKHLSTPAIPTPQLLREVDRVWMTCWLVMAAMWWTGPSAAKTTDWESVQQGERQRIAVIAQASQASISVFSPDGKGGGSGVVMTSDGLALTNYHVVKPCGTWMHCSLPDGRLYHAVLVGIDPTGDVALIKLLGRNDFPTAVVGDSDRVRVGEPCFAIGNPFLLADNFEPSVSWGIVSGVHRYQYPAGTLLEYTDCLQTDAAINPGNSGGPLFDGRGNLIGINGRCSFEKRGRVNVGVGYAISINQIKLFWDHLNSGRIVDHATLGAVVTSDSQGRVVVDDVLGTCDAFRRGLRYNDEIVSFAGRSIETVNEFKNVLGIFPRGWRVPMEYRRDGQLYQTRVRLEALHSDQQLQELVQGAVEPPAFNPDSEPDQPPQPRALTGRREVPAEVAAMIEQRPGYANYHFNQLQQDQIWTSFQAVSGCREMPSNWKITAQDGSGERVRVVLSEDQCGMQWGDSTAILEPDLELAAQPLPDGSGGLLVALRIWHQFLTGGPNTFGETFYLGGLPKRQDGVLAQVLTGRFETLETRFFFDPENHQLAELEMWTDPGLDPCELFFSDYRTVGNQRLPHRITARYGDAFEWQWSVESYELTEAKP